MPATQRPPAEDASKLSLTELDAHIARGQAEVVGLVEARAAVEKQLAATQKQMNDLRTRVKDLQDDVAHRNLHIMSITEHTDSLLLLRAKISMRILAEVESLKAQKPTPLDPNESPYAHLRATIRVPLAVQIGLDGPTNLYVGTAENISAGGVFVATFKTRPMGDHFGIVFTLPGEAEPIRTVVEVAWLRHTGTLPPGMGLKFLALDDIDQERLASFVKKRMPMIVPELA